MKLLCVKNTKKLVKGAIYEPSAIRTLKPVNQSYFRPTVSLKFGNYSSNNFTNLDGTKIADMDWKANDYIDPSSKWKLAIRDVRNLKKGDIIICNYNSGKFFEEVKMYEVSDTLYQENIKTRSNGSTYTERVNKIKISGYNRWVNPSRFRELTTQEKRNLSLNGIFGEKIDVVDMEQVRTTRKLDRLSDKEKLKYILSWIIGSSVDPSRNSLSIVEWAIQKRAVGYGLTQDDIKPFLDKKLSDLIKLIE